MGAVQRRGAVLDGTLHLRVHTVAVRARVVRDDLKTGSNVMSPEERCFKLSNTKNSAFIKLNIKRDRYNYLAALVALFYIRESVNTMPSV